MAHRHVHGQGPQPDALVVLIAAAIQSERAVADRRVREAENAMAERGFAQEPPSAQKAGRLHKNYFGGLNA